MCDNREQLIRLIEDNIRPLYPIKTNMRPKLYPRFKAKAVIFDVYGTLIISASGELKSHDYLNFTKIEDPIKILLKKYGIEKSFVQVSNDFHNQVIHIHKKLKRKGIDFPEVRYEEIWKAVTGIQNHSILKALATEYEMIVNPVYSMPHASEIISYLKEKDIYLGIISNAQFFTPFILEVLLGQELEILGFRHDLIFLSYKWNRAKPSIVLFKNAAEVLSNYGIEPEETLYVGNDIRSDIEPALNTGFKTALFAGDKRSLRTYGNNEKIMSDYVITDLNQIKKCIGD